MADEQPLQNLLVVTTVNREEYMTVKLIPKADAVHVARFMAQPGHHTMLFSMTSASVVNDARLGPKVFNLLRVSSRSPYISLEHLEILFRTKWLGKAPQTIGEEMEEVVQKLQKIAEESSNARFPVKESGTS